jgi:hypothetical protein
MSASVLDIAGRVRSREVARASPTRDAARLLATAMAQRIARVMTWLRRPDDETPCNAHHRHDIGLPPDTKPDSPFWFDVGTRWPP